MSKKEVKEAELQANKLSKEEKKKIAALNDKLTTVFGSSSFREFLENNKGLTVETVVERYAEVNGITPEEVKQMEIMGKCKKLAIKFGRKPEQFKELVEENHKEEIPQLIVKFREHQRE